MMLLGEVQVGLGEIQLRRAELVDEEVGRRTGSGPTDAPAPNISRRGFLGLKLTDDRTNIIYVAAYLDLLRKQHPPGTDWVTIYKTPTKYGEYNVDPEFVSCFAASLTYRDRNL